MRHFLIPARGGSKRILDKNLVDLGGWPLIEWTIGTAKAVATEINGEVYVSTEDEKIADVAEGCGAIIHKRPAHLADDQATMKGVVQDFLSKHHEINDVVLLYPTVPFREVATLKQAIAAYEAGTPGGRHLSLMSVGEHRGRPWGGVQILDGHFVYTDKAEAYYRGQDTPPLYFANGSIYIISRAALPHLNTQLFNSGTCPFITYGIENLDIDTPFDLEIARAWVEARGLKVSSAGAIACR